MLLSKNNIHCSSLCTAAYVQIHIAMAASIWPHHEHCLSTGTFFLFSVERIFLSIKFCSGQFLSYFTFSRYCLVASSVMTATSAVTLFLFVCKYVNLCYFCVRLHFAIYCHISNVSPFCFISVSVVLSISFLVMPE